MTGILLIQLGTPDAPTPPALKRYLRQFLWDPRVIDAPRWKWWLVLNLFILNTRPRQSATKYARIWDPMTGSPLLHYTRRQAELLQRAMPDIPVRFGMQIGNPPLGDVVREMIAQGVDRLLVLPMYPQYSDTTTASATDALFHVLTRTRRVPALRIVPAYYDHPAYLDAVATVIREELKQLPWEPEHFVYSFHGLPQEYANAGDPYPTQVVATTSGLQERLRFPDGKWTQTYQSLFGRGEWLRPYTDDVLDQLAKEGVKRVFVITPGFTADCLETIDEIGHESKELFHAAGGEELRSAAASMTIRPGLKRCGRFSRKKALAGCHQVRARRNAPIRQAGPSAVSSGVTVPDRCSPKTAALSRIGVRIRAEIAWTSDSSRSSASVNRNTSLGLAASASLNPSRCPLLPSAVRPVSHSLAWSFASAVAASGWADNTVGPPLYATI